jgi:hypothetical protein
MVHVARLLVCERAHEQVVGFVVPHPHGAIERRAGLRERHLPRRGKNEE